MTNLLNYLYFYRSPYNFKKINNNFLTLKTIFYFNFHLIYKSFNLKSNNDLLYSFLKNLSIQSKLIEKSFLKKRFLNKINFIESYTGEVETSLNKKSSVSSPLKKNKISDFFLEFINSDFNFNGFSSFFNFLFFFFKISLYLNRNLFINYNLDIMLKKRGGKITLFFNKNFLLFFNFFSRSSYLNSTNFASYFFFEFNFPINISNSVFFTLSNNLKSIKNEQ